MEPFNAYTYKVNEIAQALLNDSSDDSKICHCAPTNIEYNCTFLIDCSKLRSPADIGKPMTVDHGEIMVTLFAM